MKKETAIIFDLDGTLLSSLEDLQEAVNHQLTGLGYPTRTLEEVRQFVGNGLMNLLRRALPFPVEESLLQQYTEEMKAWYQSHSRIHTAPYDGILPLLDGLLAAGYPLAVVSNKADRAVKDLCSYYFGDRFSVAIGETRELPRKPAPDMVFLAMQTLGVTRAVYVGDSEVDVLTAQNASLPCCTVTWGFRDEEALKAAGASRLFSSPSELSAYLLSL